jgi:diguanylate cyclase (GGDEF)-like protein
MENRARLSDLKVFSIPILSSGRTTSRDVPLAQSIPGGSKDPPCEDQQDCPGEALQSLRERLALLSFVIDASKQGILLTNAEGKLVIHNQVLLRLFDLKPELSEELITGWRNVFAQQMKDPERMMKLLRQISEEKAGETLDFIELKNGRILECRSQFQVIEPLHQDYRMWSFVDCTEQYLRERELQHLSMHDPLTGTYNRAYFDMTLSLYRQSGLYPVVMVMLDVDGLKKVNDLRGHLAGDELLCQVSRILCQACRKDDVTARLGGDEFGVLLARADEATAERIIDRIQGLLNLHNIRQPDAPISLSMGYAMAQNGADMDTLVARADDVMYCARRKRREGGASR